MDSITHLTQKSLLERARQGIHHPDALPETAPPPYTPSEDDDEQPDSDMDDSEDEDDDDSPVKLTINAATSIQGSNNLVPTSPSPLADATKFSALLLHAVNKISTPEANTRTKRRVNVDLTINCGITVIGDRNVIGNVGLKPKAPEKAVAGQGLEALEQTLRGVEERLTASIAGAKRRRCEGASDDEPRHKLRRTTVSSGHDP